MSRKINDLFGSMRMVLPEHKTAILENMNIKDFSEKPYIDDDELGEMCALVFESRQYDFAISVKWFKAMKDRLGSVELTWGIVPEIDIARKRFKLVSDWDSQWIYFKDLISVTK